MSIGEEPKLTRAPIRKQAVRYELQHGNRFLIEAYDSAPPFASFLPGIAGPNGVPLWCMYVNRAQGVVSFGCGGKDNAIAEFLPATWAYQLVGVQGFRTFCKVDGEYFEPFQNDQRPPFQDLVRSMWIEPHRLSIEERNDSVGLTFNVAYFSVVEQMIPALVRELTIINTGDQARHVELLDGLPVILPSEMADFMVKKMRRLSEAYASVRILKGAFPLYSPRVKAHDEAEVVAIEGGNFYAAWVDSGEGFLPLVPIVDPDVVFGVGNSLVLPHRFLDAKRIAVEDQVYENRFACALAPYSITLAPEQSLRICVATGFAKGDGLVLRFLEQFSSGSAVRKMEQQAREVTVGATDPAFAVSAEPALDGYLRQNYLDNVLRGGIPELLPSRQGPTPLFLYTRRHGDLERDYNDFHVAPYPLSAGFGNYRDILQNRRFDVWNYPGIFDREIRTFAELLQADGYNPLVVEGYRWKWAAESGDPLAFCPITDAAARSAFKRIVERDFMPGELLFWASVHRVPSAGMEWLKSVLTRCDRRLVAHGHEGGYWIDHWTYITDLLEAFQGIYPDRVAEMLCAHEDIGWFDEGAFVRPRSEKTLQRPGRLLQMCSVSDEEPVEPPLPPVSLFAKLCALVAIKTVSFDYECRGIEMEAGRPGWNDAMNGLPGLFGSSTCEAAELARLAGWLRKALPQIPDAALPAVVADLVEEVVAELEQPKYCWDRSASLREKYRAQLRVRPSAGKRVLPGALFEKLLAGAVGRAQHAMDLAVDPATGMYHTYYQNEPAKTEPVRLVDGTQAQDRATKSKRFVVKSFVSKPLPLFLEGQVHALRVRREADQARKLYSAVKQSALFDEPLQMYKLNEPLEKCGHDIGRVRTFSRGWYENESIWLHMNHKYLIELLRSGLYDQFYADAETMLVPFMDPVVYGRSILENSSFIASSACPDPAARGRGFVARLSGTTAEFIHIWALLTVGEKPFEQAPEGLRLTFRPVLPDEWFTTEPVKSEFMGREIEFPADVLATAFLGSVLLVYHNPKRRSTYGSQSVIPVEWSVDEGTRNAGTFIPQDVAIAVRNRAISRIDVWLK